MKKYVLLSDVPKDVDRLILTTLQGLANRSGPNLYLLSDPETDGHWIEWYRNYDLEGEKASFDEALDRFLPQTEGAYRLGDQRAEIEIPLAVTLAGIDERVLVPVGHADSVAKRGVPVDPLPLPKFASRLEAAAWAMAELRPRTDINLLHSNPDGGNIDIVDYVVSRSGFSFRLTTNPVTRAGERELLGQLFRDSPPFTWLLGWFGSDEEECTYIDYASRHGIIPFCTTRNLNFSFHRHVKARKAFHKPPPAECPPLRQDRAYVTFVFSDGDAPHSMADLQKRQWKKSERGTFPFGWAIPPHMLTLGPAMLEYFYQTLTPQDELLCGPSGLGYNYLSHWVELRQDEEGVPDASRREYLRRTGELMSELDLRAMWPVNRVVEWLPDGRLLRRIAGPDAWLVHGRESTAMEVNARRYGIDFMDDDVIRDYCTHLPGCLGFFQGWHNVPNEHERIINGRSYFPGKVLAGKPKQTVQDIERVAAMEGTPCFIPVHVNCYSMDLCGVAETIGALDKSRFEVVLPTVLLRLAVQAETG